MVSRLAVLRLMLSRVVVRVSRFATTSWLISVPVTSNSAAAFPMLSVARLAEATSGPRSVCNCWDRSVSSVERTLALSVKTTALSRVAFKLAMISGSAKALAKPSAERIRDS